MKTIQITYYRNGEYSHSHKEDWEITHLYCPNCGVQNVWAEQSEGDYYMVSELLCIHCKHHFFMPLGPNSVAHDEQERQRLDGIQI